MKSLALEYHLKQKLEKADLVYINNLSDNSLKAIDFLEISQPEISIDSFIDRISGGFCYQANLSGNEESSIKRAAELFMNYCGIPNFVRGESEIIKPYLNSRGKTLERKFIGAGVGKHVVDKKK